MLNDHDAIATVAVKNLQAAAAFYEGTLSLKREATEGEELITYRSGNSLLNVYRSEYASMNKATAVTWAVGADFEAIVHALRAKGVEFEHYNMPGMTRDGDVHRNGDMQVAWFKDPDGNILNIFSRG